MSKSQVRTGRLLLWQKNPFKIHTNWSDCDGSALVGVFLLLFAALSWCLKVVICDYCQHCGSEERPHFVTYTFN